jgi:signal transduction histidine kinase
MANSKKRMDLYYDSRAPSIVIEVAEYRDGYRAVKQRGGKIRVITDITKENIEYCKKLMEMAELRHLAEVKGGLAVNETEYMATTILEEAKPLTQVIYSNVPELVAQGQHIFDTFWDLAIPAQVRIDEIEAGRVHPETVIINDPERIRRHFSELVRSSESLNIISSVSAMRAMYDGISEILDAETAVDSSPGSKTKPRIRWITVIDRESIAETKRLLGIGASVRHVTSMPPVSFALGDRQLYAAIERFEDGRVARSILASNELAYLEHFGSIFEKLWEEGVEAIDRVGEIESGVEPAKIEIIRNHRESIARAWNAVSNSKSEVFILFATPGAFRRQLAMGAAEVLQKAKANGSNVRILIPSGLGEPVEEAMKRMPGVAIKSINEKLRTKITIVVVDGKDCFLFELRDDSKDHSYDAVGIALYSDSRSIISSYGAILESLWTESEMYQSLEAHDRLQREFINIATHELRTPIQPILGLSEILASRAAAGSEEKELLSAIWRNARRLNKLAEAILDVSKIESRALNLHRETFDLNEVIASAVGDMVNSPLIANSDANVNISVVYADSKAFVLADRDRILQVVSNLLANAVKFAAEGSISVLVRIEDLDGDSRSGARGNPDRKSVVVRVKDSGPGIAPELFPRLFTKFATGSTWGTGLGLYICKGIIDAHGGTISAANNEKEGGATFTFTLPFNTLRST